MKIYVIIPAYNEASRIALVLEDIRKINIPVIVVDDGSRDNTFEIAEKYKKKIKNLIVLKHKINLGKGAALKTGCEAAFKLGAEGIIMMDSDGQHKVSDIPRFAGEINSNKHSIVFGSRNLSLDSPFIRFTGNKIASAIVSLLFGIYVSDLICGYRAFTKRAYKKIYWQSSGYGVETEMVINIGKQGLKYCEIPIETVYYDKFKGVTILDALTILFSVLKWRFFR